MLMSDRNGTWKTGREFLETFALSDDCLPGDPETDGMSYHARIWAQVCRDMLASDMSYDDVGLTLRFYIDECDRRWRAGKFFQTYTLEGDAGLEARGWTK
jgi:hypothetical protein